MEKLILLPGASGNTKFWTPLIAYLPEQYETKIIDYPGFGHSPAINNINNFNCLKNYVLDKIQAKTILIAQSMGGIFAIATAFEQPHLIKGLVLIATSGGIDLTPFNVQDWRTEYQQQYPIYPDWFIKTDVNYEQNLIEIEIPILLIWGDEDEISPIAVGQYLQSKLKNSQLYIVEGGKHDLAEKHAEEVSIYINDFIKNLG